jgi:hypothetical protein
LPGAARFGTAFRVFCKFRDVGKAARKALQQLLMEPVFCRRKRVVNPKSILASRHKTRLSEIREMTGNLGLRAAQQPDEIAHAKFAGREQVQDTESRAVCKSPKEAVHGWFRND